MRPDLTSPPQSALRWWPELAAGVTGLLVFVGRGGWPALNPTRLGWLFASGDPVTHFFGWHFFRHDPWGWPLGSFHSFLYPLGGTVGYTDSIPWLAIFFKPFSGWLPVLFQYQGLWLAACFGLQAFFGARLVSVCSPRAADRLLGGLLFALSPILIRRTGHEALCGQWLILAAMLLHVSPHLSARRRLAGAAGLIFLAAGVHPYLAMMVLSLSLALLIRVLVQRELSPRAGGGWALGLIAAALLPFFALGYLAPGYDTGAEGFGYYSADLLALFNPVGYSHIVPSAGATSAQRFEGFGYLGLGVFVLGVGALAVRWLWLRRPVFHSTLWPLALACALLAVFSLSKTVTLHGMTVLDLDFLYAPFATLTAPFRSSGRFIWPLHYLLMFTAIAGVLAAGTRFPRSATLALGTAVVLEAADFRDENRFHSVPAAQVGLSPEWEMLRGDYHHVALYPPQVLGGDDNCAHPEVLPSWYYQRFALGAARLGLTLNSGHFARVPGAAVKRTCDAFMRSFEQGAISTDTLYVVHPQGKFRIPRKQLACRAAPEAILCVSRFASNPFERWVEASPLRFGDEVPAQTARPGPRNQTAIGIGAPPGQNFRAP